MRRGVPKCNLVGRLELEEEGEEWLVGRGEGRRTEEEEEEVCDGSGMQQIHTHTHRVKSF